MIELDRELGEACYKGDPQLEENRIDAIIEMIRHAIDRSLAQGATLARRDAHAFDNGCVKAIFEVDAELDPELEHGVFRRGSRYGALIRFSDGNFVRRKWPRWWVPRAADVRGIAIKLTGVDGPKILDDEKRTQDFILVSHPRFFVDDLDRYAATLESFLKGGWFNQWLVTPFYLRSLRAAYIAFRVNFRFVTNPLFIRYWSMVPSRLGTEPYRKLAVKYALIPSPERKPSRGRRCAAFFAPGFSLKRAVRDTLATGGASFDFYIQRYVDRYRTPIEDSTVEWRESVSRLEHVGRIVIPQQTVASAEPDPIGEHLSFNPWHSLEEHRPLGLVNRVRRRVYRTISEHRRAKNKVQPAEPESPW